MPLPCAVFYAKFNPYTDSCGYSLSCCTFVAIFGE